MSRPKLQGILLAAGRGRRFRAEQPHDKLLVPCHRDTGDAPAVALAALRTLLQVTHNVLVAVPADNHALRDCLAGEPARILPVHSNGIGHSLAQAVAHCPAPANLIVALADMPYVHPSTLGKVADALRDDNLVVPTWQGWRGHPRGIGACFIDQLLLLRDDQGAKRLFSTPAVCEVVVDDAGILHDIDLPAHILP